MAEDKEEEVLLGNDAVGLRRGTSESAAQTLGVAAAVRDGKGGRWWCWWDVATIAEGWGQGEKATGVVAMAAARNGSRQCR